MMRSLALVLMTTFLAGCMTVSDRCRDAADIMTATVGFGLGAKLRCGPVQAGVLGNMDAVGLRNGSLSQRVGDEGDRWAPLDLSLVGWGEEISNDNLRTRLRGKSYHAHDIFPFVFQAEGVTATPWHYYGQFEITLGLGGSVRLGINLVEIVDFACGLVGIDILEDDLVRISRVESHFRRMVAEETVPGLRASEAHTDVRVYRLGDPQATDPDLMLPIAPHPTECYVLRVAANSRYYLVRLRKEQCQLIAVYEFKRHEGYREVWRRRDET